jgi:hypothetical protein
LRKHLGSQPDLEWIYVVDIDKKEIKVYGGGWSNMSPQEVCKKGVVDPVSYAQKLSDKYIEKEKKTIRATMRRVKRLGFKIN